MPNGKRWSRDDLLLALHLYQRIQFGQQHQNNPEIVDLARRLGRTPSSVAMKLNNFTSIDPSEAGRVRGLPGASALDQATWDEFQRPEVVEEAERLWTRDEVDGAVSDHPEFRGPTAGTAPATFRIGQRYFRRVVFSNFGSRCALTGIEVPELLTASHIVAWAEDPGHRVDPTNGLCLNRLHDAAFDRHLVTFDAGRRLVFGHRLRAMDRHDWFPRSFLESEGRPLRESQRHPISDVLLQRHRERFEAMNLDWVNSRG